MYEQRTGKWASAILAIIVLMAGLVVLSPRAAASVAPGPDAKVFTTLTIGALQEPDSMNPFSGVLSASYVIWAHTYELLVGIGTDLQPVPAIASSWEVDASNLNWTFHIQTGVKFHDGVDLTAEDVNFTFRYIWPQTAWNPIGCDLSMLQSYLGNPDTKTGVDVNNITVVDAHTLKFKTWQPKANILSMFIQILPKHVWSQIACNRAKSVSNNPPIGTGMYKVTNWVRGSYIQMDLFPQYWRLSPTEDYVDQIIIRYYKDSTGLYNAFESGVIDATDGLPADKFQLMPSTLPGASSPNVGKLTLDSIEMSEMGACLASDALIQKWGVKGGRNWLVTNLTVRRALQIAVDRANLVDYVIKGLGRPGSTLIPPATPYWHYNVTAAENYSYDLTRARSLLNDPKGDGVTLKSGQTAPGDYGQNLDPTAANNQDAFIDTDGDNIREVVNAAQVVAGDELGTSAPNSDELSFAIMVRSYSAENLAAADRMETSWGQVGIKVVTDVVSESQLITATYACSEDLYIWGWGGDVDPDFLLSVMTSGQILDWQDAWYSNSTYDHLYVEQQQQVVMPERQQTIWEMQRLLYSDAAYLVLYYPYLLTLVRTDKFTGWGDWQAHPGLGLTGYGNDFLMLQLRATGAAANQCPTKPIIEGAATRHVFVNVSTGFTANASDPESDPLTWSFFWGEGSSTTVTTASGATAAHTAFAWNVTGTYSVTVTVSDNKCGSVSTSDAATVIVDPLPVHHGWINGTVTDATNPAHPPIAGVTVTAVASGTATTYSTTTNALGAYSLTLANGTYNLLAVQALYAPKAALNIVVADNATVIDFSLEQLHGMIAGTVRSSAGGPLANATISVTGPRSATTKTAANGTYFVIVAPGTYNLTASLSGYYNQTRSNVTVAAGAVATADFSLDPVPVTQEGLSPVWLAAGAAVAIAAVALIAWLLLRRRKKAEAIVEPVLPQEPPKKP